MAFEFRSSLRTTAAHFTLLIAFAASFWTGCTPQNATPVGPADKGQSARTANSTNTTFNRSNSQTNGPTVRPDESVMGRIAFVNPSLRFVVMDFPIRRMPAREQRLNVYRSGQKVGEIKVTGPAQDTTIAGDISAGEAQIDDEVRED